LLHVITKKGKGYPPAEREPVRFHGTGPFDISTGKPKPKDKTGSITYTDVFREKIASLAKANKKIIAITAAMPEGTGLDKFRDLYPERFFDIGIAESHAVCFAAGLARGGFKPVVAIYSTFLQRAYDNIMQEVALQDLGVVFAIDRAGIVGEDGVTHQGIFDIAFLRNIPNLVIMAPKDGPELEAMLEFSMNLDKPVAIRYPKSVVADARGEPSPLELNKAEILTEGKDFAIIAIGSMVNTCFEAMRLLEEKGFSGELINARFIKPLDISLFRRIAGGAKFVFTVEEAVLEGGFGSAVSESIEMPLTRIGLPCEFIMHGRRDILLEKYGLTAQGIAKRVLEVIKGNG
jgi:1-deoxy-D-xylulose-5-phosphate synthase